ncbi:hypothetical protein P8452_16138 [Trifolium repens]|jgi:hypothetical protein|nr:hypothetical protein QL285_056168 [Trifolium repens]WJX27305.1 hypothetical protein P8452_16138 [Trifolium repens]
MGNCVAYHSQTKKQTRCSLIEGREIEVNVASKPVEKMNTASGKHYTAVHRKVKHGEVYHLAPFLRQSDKPCMITDDRKTKTRIVLTTEELEILLGGSKTFQIQSRIATVRKSFVLTKCPKWLPSIPTIQEVQNV